MVRRVIKPLRVSVICSTLMATGYALANHQSKLIEGDTQNLSKIESEKIAETTTLKQVQIQTATISETERRKMLRSWIPAQIKPVFFDQLVRLYSANQMQPLWQDKIAVQRFEQQLSELALAGFQPQFGQWLAELNDAQLSDKGRDLILSDAMLGYLQFVSDVGHQGQRWFYHATPYKIVLPSSEVIEQWQQAMVDHNVAAYVAALAPQHPQYENMRKEMMKQLADSKPWPQLSDKSALKPGQSSSDVVVLREILIRLGMLSELTTQSDHVYDPELVTAVKNFQHWQGLAPDGVIGKRTRDWLNTSPQTRAGLIALNIQRLRIIPSHVSTGIMVNIPDYSLYYYLNDQEVLDSKVIVGRPSRKTPIMSSVLNNVVINPPWSVPTSLARKDIAPRGLDDPGYFQRGGYVIFSNWRADASVIDPYTIDWSVITPANFPYRIWQAPGPTNSLGRYKFNMPNSDAIYLHDTPNHNLFNKDIRAISSGCVRINKASELANMLLGDVGWTQNKVTNTVKQGNTVYVNIPQRIPVYLYYLTAWVDEQGIPQYRTDIYDYDNSVGQGSQFLSKLLPLQN
ncbi:L,D-transpeptidase [Photorhabdus namnaonensis]|uniref:Murein L,D-transpeptidase n=1 Tax=Photorhabdus namnaonensis TaxID=1851568 RepID=A0A1B8YGJ2_9GAMM|nr:L,D-transpeptidase [Photorhabdus namnaonensis]OCA54256.1 murein L,D-transpeptidase [Photorhabdus namnaonensis]